MTLYNATALAEEVGATYRQIHYWTEKGALRPVAIKGTRTVGSGNVRVYDGIEAEVARGLVLLSRGVEEWGGEIRRAVTTSAAHLPHGFVLTHRKAEVER